MSFSTLVPESRFTEYVMQTMEAQYKKNPKIRSLTESLHPIEKELKAAGNVRTDLSPTIAEAVPLRYAIDSTFLDLSQNSGIKPLPYKEYKATTVAWYKHIMTIETFMISMWEYLMCQDSVAMMKIVQQRLEGLEQGWAKIKAERIWNGVQVDGTQFWGIKHFSRQVTQTGGVIDDPVEGAIGNVSAGTISAWCNQYINASKPAITWNSGGAMVESFLDDSDGWEGMWLDCITNSAQYSPEGQPNLIPCNLKMWLYLKQLQERRRCFCDDAATKELGTEVIRFKTAKCFYDPDMPVIDATKGEARFLNTDSFYLGYVKGIEKAWGQPAASDLETSFKMQRRSCYVMCAEDLRMNGYIIGVTDPATV